MTEGTGAGPLSGFFHAIPGVHWQTSVLVLAVGDQQRMVRHMNVLLPHTNVSFISPQSQARAS